MVLLPSCPSPISGPGWYPTFGTNLAPSDVKYPLCGPGTINPAHMLSTVSIRGGGGGGLPCNRGGLH